ncbi:hypothetical protein [Okeania sp. SIO2B3]|nr:hypothetical protein [Okeania sp. SIO2B3]NET46728.1 hypothetical protein [Okeania sp. SIO2B3]
MAETPVLSEVGNSLFFVTGISLEVRTQKLELTSEKSKVRTQNKWLKHQF